MQFEAVVSPDVNKFLDEIVHHFGGVVGRGRDPQPFLAQRHCRVVDGLDVNIVLGHQLIAQFRGKSGVSDLCSNMKTVITSRIIAIMSRKW